MFIELYHRYQSLFNFDTRLLSISSFLQQPTIAQHSQLLETVTTDTIDLELWHPLHIVEGNTFLHQLVENAIDLIERKNVEGRNIECADNEAEAQSLTSTL